MVENPDKDLGERPRPKGRLVYLFYIFLKYLEYCDRCDHTCPSFVHTSDSLSI